MQGHPVDSLDALVAFLTAVLREVEGTTRRPG